MKQLVQTWRITTEGYSDVYLPIQCVDGVPLEEERLGDKFQVLHHLQQQIPNFEVFKVLTVELHSQVDLNSFTVK